jgi:hypothetical protein
MQKLFIRYTIKYRNKNLTNKSLIKILYDTNDWKSLKLYVNLAFKIDLPTNISL